MPVAGVHSPVVYSLAYGNPMGLGACAPGGPGSAQADRPDRLALVKPNCSFVMESLSENLSER
jgi:hypothetical protein